MKSSKKATKAKLVLKGKRGPYKKRKSSNETLLVKITDFESLIKDELQKGTPLYDAISKEQIGTYRKMLPNKQVLVMVTNWGKSKETTFKPLTPSKVRVGVQTMKLSKKAERENQKYEFMFKD